MPVIEEPIARMLTRKEAGPGAAQEIDAFLDSHAHGTHQVSKWAQRWAVDVWDERDRELVRAEYPHLIDGWLARD